MKKLFILLVFSLVLLTSCDQQDRLNNLSSKASVVPTPVFDTTLLQIHFLACVHGAEDPVGNGFSVYSITKDSVEYILINTASGVSISKTK